MSALPKYLQLQRREARIHHRQADDLTTLRRNLNDARRRGKETTGERITDNTLIRVAIDLMLTYRDQLRGTTENELRLSVGLPTLGNDT